MTSRALLWIGFLIALSGLLTYYSVEKSLLAEKVKQSQQQFQTEQLKVMADFLETQKDGRKLVRLAKNIDPENGELIKMVILKAFELSPESRDIAILASTYSEDAKKKILEIDPLYKK